MYLHQDANFLAWLSKELLTINASIALAAEQIFQAPPIRPKTSQTYNSVYRCYIYPALHQYELAEIKREHIQNLIKSLPPQTGATTLAVLKTIFREAIDNVYCEHSPAATVRRPKIQVIPRKFIPLPDLMALDLPKFKTQIIFLAMHGLRWGEAVALTDDDIYEGGFTLRNLYMGK